MENSDKLTNGQFYKHVSLNNRSDIEKEKEKLEKRITELERTLEKQIIINEAESEKFRLAYSVSADVIWDWNLLTGKLFLSDRFEELFGYHLKDNKGTIADWSNFIHPDNKKSVEQGLRSSITSTATQWTHLYNFIKADGSIAKIFNKATILRKPDGKAYRIIGAMQDLSNQKILEEKLHLEIAAKEKLSVENTESFNLLFSTAIDVLYDHDLVTGIVKISDAYEKEYGYKVSHNMTPVNDWLSHIHPDEKESVYNDYLKMLESKDLEWKYKYRFLRADGSIVNVVSIAIIVRDAHGKAYRVIGSMQDLNKQKVLEEKLKLEIKSKEWQIAGAIDEAKETERSALGRELHDNVNQLLGASKLFLEMARQGGDKSQNYLDRSTEYTLLAIEEIRKLSKGLTNDVIKTIGLCGAITDIARETVEVSPIKISCLFKGFNEDSVNDKFKLNIFRIVQEQINNILKHANATKADICISQKKRVVTLSIIDNGNGFDTDKKQDGIGIANIKSRAASYRGKAVFISHPGNGCCLTVRFPDDILNDVHSGFFHESEALAINVLHHHAFDNSLQPNIISTVKSGNIIAVNSAACKLFGYSKEELLKNNRTDVFNINETNFKKMLRQRSTFGQATAFVKAIKKNGESLPCLITSAVFTGEDGIEKSITTVVDMSSIILKQKKIDTKKEKLFAENNKIAIANQKNTDDENQKVVDDNIEIAISKQKDIDVENQKVVANNIEIAISKQKDIDVINQKVVANNINLAQAKSNALLAENNQNFLLAAKLSFDIIWDWDILTNELLIGDGCKELFGYTINNNKSTLDEWLDYIHGDDKNKVVEGLNKAIESTFDNWECSYRIIKSDGSVSKVFTRANIFRNANGKAIRMIGALQDTTEKKKLESEKEFIIQELMKSNADLQQFSFIISHNLRSPLSNIQAILKIIDYKDMHSENVKMLRLLSSSGRQLTKTIDDLTNILVIKNKVNLESSRVSLQEAFTNLFKTFFSALDTAGAKVFTDFKDPNIYFNSSYLESILINLLSNAIKYRSPKRDLIIQASSFKDTTGNTVFRFSDNGSGIDTKKHGSRIFGLYQRFHSGNEGQGLGLYIVKSQIEALKGKIEIESELNKGTTFIITFKKQVNLN